MNILRRGPLGLKPEKQGKDRLHLARVAALPCAVCEAFGEVQDTPTQVHHVICGRFGQHKTPDRMAIPLCADHHLTGPGRPCECDGECGEFCTAREGKMAIHSFKASWVAKYGPDYAFTAATQDKLGI